MFGRIIQRTNNRFSSQNDYPVMPIKYLKPPSREPLTQTSQTSNTTIEKTGKLKWGPSVWIFLHTIAEKIKPENFNGIKTVLIQFIYSICINLPCPECSIHAKKYLDTINLNAIQTKDDLKKMLFVFHNYVNARKGYAIFEYNELDTKYKTAITINVINHFMHNYTDKNGVVKLISENLFRNRIVQTFKEWFKKNYSLFDP